MPGHAKTRRDTLLGRGTVAWAAHGRPPHRNITTRAPALDDVRASGCALARREYTAISHLSYRSHDESRENRAIASKARCEASAQSRTRRDAVHDAARRDANDTDARSAEAVGHAYAHKETSAGGANTSLRPSASGHD